MALRKCPGCKNLIAAETESCPICGCNPRTRRFRKYLFWSVAVAAIGILLQDQLRERIRGIGSPGPAQAQTDATPR